MPAVRGCPSRVLIATGGTGGHILPALVTAAELRLQGADVFFLGAFGPAGARLGAAGFSFKDIDVSGFVGRGPVGVMRSAGRLWRAVGFCRRELVRYQPDVVAGFGGYGAVAPVLAAAMAGVPVLLHEQNVRPGLANRVAALAARRIAVSFRESESFFPKGRVVWSGYPLRPLVPAGSAADARRRFGLAEDLPTVLVFGGSQGSRALNEAFVSFLESAGKRSAFQAIHLTGTAVSRELQSRLSGVAVRTAVFAGLPDMMEAYAAANVVLARSGAGTVAELAAVGLPAVLVPYPHAGGHQTDNARVLERRGQAVIIQENHLNPRFLGDNILRLLRDHPGRFPLPSTGDDLEPGAAARLAAEILAQS